MFKESRLNVYIFDEHGVFDNSTSNYVMQISHGPFSAQPYKALQKTGRIRDQNGARPIEHSSHGFRTLWSAF